MRDYFLAELDCIDNGKYKNYYKVFLMDENVNTETIGYSWNLSNIPYVVCFNNTKNYDSVIAYEILHALELAHPFDAYSRNTPFNHHFGSTNNIMDYSQTFHVLPNSATKINPVNGRPFCRCYRFVSLAVANYKLENKISNEKHIYNFNSIARISFVLQCTKKKKRI